MRQCSHEQRVAVRPRARDRFSRDGAARSSAVLDHKLLSELFTEPLRSNACNTIRISTRRERNDDHY